MFGWLWNRKQKNSSQTPSPSAPDVRREPPPPRKISQRTISVMIALYSRLFIETGPYWGAGPPLDIKQFRNILFAMGFSREFLDECEYRYHWHFAALLPALNDGSFYAKDHGFMPPQAQSDGQFMLLNLATALCGVLAQHPECAPEGTRHFTESLLDDGFQFVGKRLVETSQDIIPETQEISAVESLVRLSIHDNQTLLIHHFADGNNLFDSGQYHACVNEWRSFLEETLRGVWRLTRNHRPEFATFSETPPMGSILDYLQRAGFLKKDEQLAFSSTWGFLCAGGHPGISDRDDAHLSMILALTFGHAALLKLQKWAAGSFISF